MAKLIDSRHPDYDELQLTLYRDIISLTAKKFIDKYLYRYTVRERANDFVNRKKLTSLPAYAKTCLVEIKNSLYDRLPDVVRENCPQEYLDIVAGKNGGIDLKGSSMTAFMGSSVILDLIGMGKIGIFVDMPVLEPDKPVVPGKINPYVYTYAAEDILSWTYDSNQSLQAVLLRHTVLKYEKGLATGTETNYLFYHIDEGQVVCDTYDKDDTLISSVVSELTEIPLYIATLPHSLLVDVAHHQITLLNLNSSDIHFTHQANFPLYTEQYDPASDAASKIPTDPLTEQYKREEEHKSDTNKEVSTGPTQGRRYPKGLERPDYISPSPEPLRVGMAKQDRLIQEIRQLLQLSLANMREDQRSADSRKIDNHGLEAGLASVGVELEKIERFVQYQFCQYTSKTPGEIFYPRSYETKSDAERLAEAKELNEIIKSSPSLTFQKEVSKKMANNLLSSCVSVSTLRKIEKEIDGAKIIYVDPETVQADVETGLVTTQTAATIRGYGAEEATKAQVQRAERAAQIVAAQNRMAARGAKDLDPNDDSASAEKKESQDSSLSPDNKSGTRS